MDDNILRIARDNSVLNRALKLHGLNYEQRLEQAVIHMDCWIKVLQDNLQKKDAASIKRYKVGDKEIRFTPPDSCVELIELDFFKNNKSTQPLHL